ncbi:MAG TPA: 6-carboxytetrahydropterin synthase [Bacteroidales bacterium]|nr:6-carboxytetrahydropterin synthase [Bacteroidales bacterium]
MAKIRLTKEFKFEMAHALQGYDGPCRNIHGHSYYLYVTVIGEPVSNDDSPVNGMVMDFTELKNIVRTEITDQLDHALVLSDKTPPQLLAALKGFNNIILLPYQPTCENMLQDFALRLKEKLPATIRLFSLKLCETVTSSAEWFAADNE